MNILQLEQERTTLKKKLTSSYSTQARLLFISTFFEKVLSTENKNIIDSSLPEFIPEYVYCLKNFSVFGLMPRIHESIINQAEQIKNSGHTSGFGEFSGIPIRLKNDLEKLQKILNGLQNEMVESKAFFPLLEEEAIKETGMTIGVLESATIKISKTKNADKFIIIPSEKEIEEKISEQVVLSWFNAISFTREYIRRIHPYHEVIISFDKKVGFCKGNSLGTALTLSFIEEIFKTYNSPISIGVGEGIAFTGGMDEQGRITNTSDEIINQKTGLIFYSIIKIFVVPKDEEEKANEKLNDLKKDFPQRDLRIIGIEDIGDLLNRRNIVEIKKQPVVVRAGKFVKKNWVSAAVAVLLTVILSFLFVLDLDTNPYSFTADTSKIYIKNKSGKVLWTKNCGLPKKMVDEPNYLKGVAKIVDINSDGENEVVLTFETNSTDIEEEQYRVTCYSFDGIKIWSYSINESIVSKRTVLPCVYSLFILDTLSFYGTKNLFVIAGNTSSFSSAIFRVDLKTGKRLPGTLWCSGHTVNGIIKDINGDGKKDIFCVGLDNGFEDAVSFGFEIDTLTMVRPTTDEYLIRGFPVADFITYIRYPKTDYDMYRNFRTPGIFPASFTDKTQQKFYQFYTMDHLNEYSSCLWYQIDYNLKDVNIVVDNRYRIMRDTLVAHGKLLLPYTDTPEYVGMQKSKILYWKNGEWVKRKDLE